MSDSDFRKVEKLVERQVQSKQIVGCAFSPQYRLAYVAVADGEVISVLLTGLEL